MSPAEELQPLGLHLDWIEPLTIFGQPDMSIRPVLGELGVIGCNLRAHLHYVRIPKVLLQFDLNQNDRDALLRHYQSFRPCSGEPREDARLTDALAALQLALQQYATEHQSDGDSEARRTSK